MADATRTVRRRVTPTCQGQTAITTPDQTPAATAPEPVKKKTKTHRSQRADDWAHTTVGDPRPCVLCGFPAFMRDPYTDRPCHLNCARQDATQNGEQW